MEPLTPERHGLDLHLLVEALGAGPVDVLASSGGAVNLLALAASYPDHLRVAVAHEPPTVALLEDRAAALGACLAVRVAYDDGGLGPAMARFITLVTSHGPISPDHADAPAPDPATFGLPVEDDGSRTHPLLRNIPACNAYEPDLERLRRLGARLVVGVGETSGDQLAARGARSVAAALGREPVVFPGDHGGFTGDGAGAFAAALLGVLAG